MYKCMRKGVKYFQERSKVTEEAEPVMQRLLFKSICSGFASSLDYDISSSPPKT